MSKEQQTATGKIWIETTSAMNLLGETTLPPHKIIRAINAYDDLVAVLRRVMPRPITGNPSNEELVEHWEYEKSQGNGSADDALFALAAIAKAGAE